MGLTERRAVQTLKETDFKAFEAFEAKMKTICGFDIKLNFDFAALEAHPDCVRIIERKSHHSYMFERVENAFTALCADDMGKTAVREKIKEVVMLPKAGEMSFAGGVFTIQNDLTGNGAYDADSIQKELEKNL